MAEKPMKRTRRTEDDDQDDARPAKLSSIDMQRRHQEATYRANFQHVMMRRSEGFCDPLYDGCVLRALRRHNANLFCLYGKEVSVQADEAVLVLYSGHKDWWIVRNVKGEEGFLPNNCLDPRTAQPLYPARRNPASG